MFFDRFLHRRATAKSPPQTDQPAFFQRLGDELLQTLGSYDPVRHTPVVYSPIQTRNRWSRATLVHEQVHQDLTINTTYGLLFQALAVRGARRGLPNDLLSACLRAQWGVQEGTATYLQLVIVGIDDPEGLDEAVSLLPSEQLGQPPYREWFDRLAHLLPLRSLGAPADPLQDTARTDFVLALGLYALNPDIFAGLPPPQELSLSRFEAFLERGGPDGRLLRTLECLRQDNTMAILSGQFSLLREQRSESTEPIDWLMRKLASLNPDDGYVDDASRRAQADSFVRAWYHGGGRPRIMPAQPGPSTELPLPSVRYVPDWAERFPDSIAKTQLTLDIFRAQLVAVQFAACFFDPSRPGIYALQGVQGGAGADIFFQIMERMHLHRHPGKLSELPHASLIRLAGQGFLL
jgi:hypothetical protein